MVNPNRTPVADLAEIRRGLQVYCQQGLVYEIRALGTGIEGKGVTFGYYDDLELMAHDAATLSGKARGIYFTPNPVNPDLLQRSPNRLTRFIRSNPVEGNQGNALTHDADVTSRRWLLIDFDPVCSNGIKDSPATDAEEQAAINQGQITIDWPRSLGWPDPLIVASGNGCQLSYLMDQPNNEESQILIERCLHAVAHLFRNPTVKLDTSVHNAGRIWKVAGTLSRKGTPSPDRPHRLARILEAPEALEVVALAQLEGLAAVLPAEVHSRPTGGQVDAYPNGQGDYSTLDAISWFQSHGHYGRKLGSGKHAVRCPWENQHTEKRPAADSDSVIWEAVRGNWPTFHCSHDHCQGRTIHDVIILWQDADHFCASPFQRFNGGNNYRLAKFDEEHNTPDNESANTPPAWQPKLLLSPEELGLVSAQDIWPNQFVWYAAKRTDAPIEFLEAAALAILSVAVGRKARLVLTTGPVIPTIWIMLVADSTRYRKSTVIALASDGVEKAHLDVLAPDDFSPQRFINLMAERSGKPTLFRRDEFGGFYEGLNRLEHQAGGKQILIAFHDGRDYRKELVGLQQRDKKTGTVERKPEIIEVKEPFLSILAGTQRDLLLSQAQAGDIFSGFLPRFAFIAPENLPQRKDVLELDSSIEQQRDILVAELRRISNAPMQDMYLEPGVLQRWNRYTADLEVEMEAAPVPSIAGPVFDRMGHMALKIALLLSFYDGNKVTMSHLLAGIEVAERWRVQSYKLLTAIGPSREEKAVQRIFDLVRRKPGIKRRDIMSSLRLSAREMDASHATLTQRGWVKVVEQGRGTAYYPGEAATSISLETLECLSGAKNSFSGGTSGPDHQSDEAYPEKIGPIKHSSVSSNEAHTGPATASLFDYLPMEEEMSSIDETCDAGVQREEIDAENTGLNKHSSVSSNPPADDQWEEEL